MKSGSVTQPWSIHNMPLDIFFDKMVREDMTDAQDVLDEYLFSLAGAQDKHMMNLERDIVLLRYKIVKGSAGLFTIAYSGSDKVAAELIKLGATAAPYPLDREKQVIWFRMVNSSISRWVVELRQKQAQIDRLQPVASTPAPALTMDYFIDAITELSKYMKFNIDEKTTTVARYISMLKNFSKHVESYARK